MRTALTTSCLQRLLTVFCLLAVTENIYAGEEVPSATMVLDNAACIQCHNKHDSALVRDWENSAHARVKPAVDCVSCHGARHSNMAATARHDESCTNCHGGEKAPVAHSYSSSKHGTLMRIEKNGYDWSQPLQSANYRTPGCGYCHMHSGNHNVSKSVRHELMTNDSVEAVQDYTRSVCQDCHSPRYITRLLENGEAMLEIARKKVREASALINQAEKNRENMTLDESGLLAARRQLEKMRQHLTNVQLGIGHQSPDYQWWHGQPALDGDLLRIKDSIGELYRNRP